MMMTGYCSMHMCKLPCNPCDAMEIARQGKTGMEAAMAMREKRNAMLDAEDRRMMQLEQQEARMMNSKMGG